MILYKLSKQDGDEQYKIIERWKERVGDKSSGGMGEGDASWELGVGDASWEVVLIPHEEIGSSGNQT